MTSVIVSRAAAGDMLSLAPLFMDMLDFHNLPQPAGEEEMAAILERDGPAGRQRFDCLIARGSDGLAQGFALYSTVYEAAFLGDGLFLRDIFVSARYRGQGVGKALMVALARVCVEDGYRRIDWHADRLDLHARTFYELLAPDSFKLNRLSYRIENEDIIALSRKQSTDHASQS